MIIIKTSRTGPSVKNKVIYKLLSQPHKHLLHEKRKRNQQLNSPLNPSSVPLSNTVQGR